MLSSQKKRAWPSGESQDIAAINISDQELERRTNQALSRGSETGRGVWFGLGGELPSGKPVEFVRYSDGPLEDCYIVRTDKALEPSSVLAEILHELDIAPESVSWSAAKPSS